MINEEFPLEQDQEEELFEHFKIIVDRGQEMVRIDKYLLDRMPNTSRSKIQSAAKNGNIVVNTQKVKQNYKVKPADEVSIVLPYPVREFELIAENIPLTIVYEFYNQGKELRLNSRIYCCDSFLLNDTIHEQ